MAQKKFSAEDIHTLMSNPYVMDANDSRILYTPEFKRLFMEEYLAGKGPTQIFRESGFDPRMLGGKRIERAAARWKIAYEKGRIS